MVGKDVNESLMESASMQAGVPVVCRKHGLEELGSLGSGVADAVVVLEGLQTVQNLQAFFSAVLKVLKPGGRCALASARLVTKRHLGADPDQACLIATSPCNVPRRLRAAQAPCASCRFIFIHSISADAKSGVQSLLGAEPLAMSKLEALKRARDFESVQWDVANEALDPHVVGLAVKKAAQR